jgi:hypothetical protein
MISDMKPLSDKEVDIVFKWLKVRNVLSVPVYVDLGFFSSCGTISMLEERVQSLWRSCRTRNTEMLFRFDCIMTGTREFI